MASNQLKLPPQAPCSFNHTVASLHSDARALIETMRAVEDKIVASVAPENATFANVLQVSFESFITNSELLERSGPPGPNI
jgi:metallopeptidase MepB